MLDILVQLQLSIPVTGQSFDHFYRLSYIGNQILEILLWYVDHARVFMDITTL